MLDLGFIPLIISFLSTVGLYGCAVEVDYENEVVCGNKYKAKRR